MLPFDLMDIAFTLLTVALVVGVLVKVRYAPYRLFMLALGVTNLSVYMYSYIFQPEVNSPRRLSDRFSAVHIPGTNNSFASRLPLAGVHLGRTFPGDVRPLCQLDFRKLTGNSVLCFFRVC